MKKTKNLEPSQRQLRVGEEIRHLLADIFMRSDIHVEGLSGVSVTVTEVDVSPDLRNATAYVSPLGGAMGHEELADILNEAAAEFNRAIAKKLVMKFTPRLTFSADNRFDYAEKIEALLKKTKLDE
jgi:ribosome-binding factor A